VQDLRLIHSQLEVPDEPVLGGRFEALPLLTALT
jgi:hypothetical protein